MKPDVLLRRGGRGDACRRDCGRGALDDSAAPEFAAIRKEVWACKLDRGNIRANAEKYLLDIGVPQAHIDAFREIMLEK